MTNQSFARSPGSFGRTSLQITPNNDTDLPTPIKSLMVIASGTLAFIPADNADDETVVVAEDLPVGFILPFVVRRVLASGTSASVVGIGW